MEERTCILPKQCKQILEPLNGLTEKRNRITIESASKSLNKNSHLLINKFIENPGLQHIGETIFLYLDRKSFLKCMIVCKSWKDFLETPRISIKYARQILPEKLKNMWDLWINTTKVENTYKLTVEELLKKMLKNHVLRNPMYMAMTMTKKMIPECYIYSLFEYIYPIEILKCPICGKKLNDSKVELDGKMRIHIYKQTARN